MEKYGVVVIERAVVACAEVLKVAYEVFVEKKGIWHLFGLQSVIQSIVAMDFANLKLEISDLSEAERESVEAKFKAGLPAALQASVGGAVDLLEEAIDLVEDVVAFVKDGYVKGLAFVAKAKALVGA